MDKLRCSLRTGIKSWDISNFLDYSTIRLKIKIYPSFLFLSRCVFRIETINDQSIMELQTSLGWKWHLKLTWSTPLQWAEISSAMSGCSEPCPIWLWMSSGMAHPLPGVLTGISWHTYYRYKHPYMSFLGKMLPALWSHVQHTKSIELSAFRIAWHARRVFQVWSLLLLNLNSDPILWE